jgi:hypothetical protein
MGVMGECAMGVRGRGAVSVQYPVIATNRTESLEQDPSRPKIHFLLAPVGPKRLKA